MADIIVIILTGFLVLVTLILAIIGIFVIKDGIHQMLEDKK